MIDREQAGDAPDGVTGGAAASELISTMPGLNMGAGASGPSAVGLTMTGATSTPTIPVARMLEYVIEGYLFGDLESMATEITPKEMGAAGYPMVMSVLAGAELLGALTSDARPDNRIETYLVEFMSKVNPLYADLGEIASALARNGIAHSYLSHLGVVVTRGESSRHLTLWRGEVVFDCVELYTDFRRSYEEYSRAFILGHIADAQRRLDGLLQYDHEKARSLISKLSPDRFPVTAPGMPSPTMATSPAVRGSFATPLHVRPSRDAG